ncbi:PLDc_N domain-containing protein [Silicimonas algicola]|nr:PLDc_N domain-containing protein [Silicimonas algicola]
MWALISVLRSKAPLTTRTLWLVILLLPGLGFVAWYLLGPRESAA